MQNEKVTEQVIALRKELVSFAQRLALGSALDAEDVVQEAIVKVLSVDTDLENYNVRAYLYRAVRNTFINLNKREARMVSMNRGSMEEDGEGVSHDQAISDLLASPSAETVVLEGISPEMNKALSTLHAGIRETFLLVTIHGLQYQECAEFQNISIGTVMSRIARAKKQMKVLLSA